MKFCVISSGSKGNMTYLEEGNTKILIDAGISLSSAQMRCPNIDFKNITDILITHEHGDHSKFLDTIAHKTKANIYMSKKSYMALPSKIKDGLVGFKIGFIDGESKYTIGDVKVLTLNLVHDVANIFGFIIIGLDKKFGIFTDTGIFPGKYKDLLKDLDGFVIEANHNIEMLQNSNRDFYLIGRVLSASGHLSNQACYELLSEVLNDKNKYVVLGHVSEDCNCDECLYQEIINKLSDYKGTILIARQNKALDMIEL